ncbi:hypothetical protein GGH98_006427, partial [Coemansia sp. RSA 454]
QSKQPHAGDGHGVARRPAYPRFRNPDYVSRSVLANRIRRGHRVPHSQVRILGTPNRHSNARSRRVVAAACVPDELGVRPVLGGTQDLARPE